MPGGLRPTKQQVSDGALILGTHPPRLTAADGALFSADRIEVLCGAETAKKINSKKRRLQAPALQG